MIDAPTRARWRKLFNEARRGPWAVDMVGGSPVVLDGYRSVLGDASASGNPLFFEEDAAFIAQARDGWPQTLTELTAVEAERDAVKIEIEHIENRHMVTLQRAEMVARDLVRQRDDLAAQLSGMRGAMVAAVATADCMLDEIERLRPLREAVRAWVKHRYSPGLLKAWEASGWKSSS